MVANQNSHAPAEARRHAACGGVLRNMAESNRGGVSLLHLISRPDACGGHKTSIGAAPAPARLQHR
jgi:hypothetical protein